MDGAIIEQIYYEATLDALYAGDDDFINAVQQYVEQDNTAIEEPILECIEPFIEYNAAIYEAVVKTADLTDAQKKVKADNKKAADAYKAQDSVDKMTREINRKKSARGAAKTGIGRAWQSFKNRRAKGQGILQAGKKAIGVALKARRAKKTRNFVDKAVKYGKIAQGHIDDINNQKNKTGKSKLSSQLKGGYNLGKAIRNSIKASRLVGKHYSKRPNHARETFAHNLERKIKK